VVLTPSLHASPSRPSRLLGFPPHPSRYEACCTIASVWSNRAAPRSTCTALLGRQKLTIKKNLRKFCGFAGGDVELKKKAELLKKMDGKLIKKVLEVCDLQLSGTKAESIDRLLAFLSKPEASGKKSLVEKVGEKRKAAERKKGTTQSKKSKTAQGKVEKKKRPKTAYQLYADSRRDKVKAENPGASFGELNKIMGEKWKTISDERKAKYVEQAAELKKEFDAKEGKAPKASPSKKAKKEAEEEEEEEKEEAGGDEDEADGKEGDDDEDAEEEEEDENEEEE